MLGGDSLGGRSEQSVLNEFLVGREIHRHLRALERHLDAFLLLEGLKERIRAADAGGGLTNENANGQPHAATAQELLEWIENDAECVETAFRHRMVSEVYRDMERPECLAKLTCPAPQTDSLVERMREKLQRNGSNLFACWRAAPNKIKAQRQEQQDAEQLLLTRVLTETTHPLLVSNEPLPWKLVVDDGPSLRIHLRSYKDNPEKISFRLEGTVGAPLICILSVLNEVDLFSRWLPYYTRPFKLGLRKAESTEFGRVDKMVQFHIDFPWPFANRDACFETFAVDDFERNSQIVVKMLTLDQDCRSPRQRMAIPAPSKSVQRLLVDGSMVIQPLGPRESRVSLLWHENCRMRVPVSMADFVTKLFARSAFRCFSEACVAAMDGEMEQRRQMNPDLYGLIEDRLRQVGLSVPPDAMQAKCGLIPSEGPGQHRDDAEAESNENDTLR